MNFYLENYGCYREIVEKGYMTIHTSDLNGENISSHFDNLINILYDGIETEAVQRSFINIIFTDNEEVELTIFDYLFNLLLWQIIAPVKQIESIDLFYYNDITKNNIKEYIDKAFVKRYRTTIDFKKLNNSIDDAMFKFTKLTNLQMFLANTVNLEDTIDLMNKYPEFNDTVHLDLTNVSMEDAKDVGMKATHKQIEYIKKSDHCLRDSFASGEAISPKQFKEVNVNIGTKPDGQGSVFPCIINNSFINGGLNTPETICIESSVGRIAQILQKSNVGLSGAFARVLGLNNKESRLHHDPNYSCDTKNFEVVHITNNNILKIYDMRYYRYNPKGIDYLIDSDTCDFLIGQTIYVRSPMTCASGAANKGICYKCYGNLAYVNKDINIGKMSAELLSSIFTQILLSAKHLLESLVIKMQWPEIFDELFEINFNTIKLKQDCDFSGWKMVIRPWEIDMEDEMDELDWYNEYVTSFDVIDPKGNVHQISTITDNSDSDNIYFHSDLANKINKFINDNPEAPIELDFNSLKDIPILFVLYIRNSELSRTMDMVKKMINKKDTMKKYDRNTILEAFIGICLEGGIHLNAIHFEMLLSNQIRSAEDKIEIPDWTRENAPYQLMTLGEALTNHPSITVRLEYSRVPKTLINPDSFRVTKASATDLYFMEKPQEHLNNTDSVSDKNLLINDIEDNKSIAINFEDGFELSEALNIEE